MANTLHIIDERTSADMLDQLRLLAGPEERAACVGTPPRYAAFDLSAESQHAPLGSATLCGWRMRNMGNDATLAHAWSCAAGRAAAAISKFRSIPVLRSLPAAPRGEKLAALVKASRKRALHVTVPTEAARKSLVSAGAKESAVHVLPPSAEAADDLAGRRARTRQVLGLSDDDVLLVAAAEMVRGAGHKYASWAHAIVRQILPNLRLLLPGGGPAERHVRFFAGTTGYDSEVFFTGDRFRRGDCLAACDVACFFSERDCGVSALAAALAAGAAVAASNTADHAELLNDEKDALLVLPGDPRSASAAILRLAEDADLRRRLAQAARQRARQFDPAAGRKRLQEIYQRVLAAEVG